MQQNYEPRMRWRDRVERFIGGLVWLGLASAGGYAAIYELPFLFSGVWLWLTRIALAFILPALFYVNPPDEGV